MIVKTLLVAESYAPRINGVSNSVIKVADYLKRRGCTPLVLAAGPSFPAADPIDEVRVRSFQPPFFVEYDFALTSANQIEKILIREKIDLVHLASPFFLGKTALRAANNLGIPSVAVYQTDVSGFARAYGFKAIAPVIDWKIANIHKKSTLNLAPSKSYCDYLTYNGVKNVYQWGRGVDLNKFNPDKFDNNLKKSWSRSAKYFVGFVGRLAPEKNISDLVYLANDPNIQIVIIGKGPAEEKLKQQLPNAIFTGQLTGELLASAMATLDVVVATGRNETFCQVVQEVKASGTLIWVPDKGASQELISHEIDGFIYSTERLSELKNEIFEVVENSTKREKIEQKARVSVLGKSWEIICDQLYQFYEVALTARRLQVA
jgi:phosphatidylinositol alpha 1,6-mannosyltransferase